MNFLILFLLLILSFRIVWQPFLFIQAHPNPSVNWSEIALKALKLPNIMSEDVPCKPLDFYTCPFRKSKINRYLHVFNYVHLVKVHFDIIFILFYLFHKIYLIHFISFNQGISTSSIYLSCNERNIKK